MQNNSKITEINHAIKNAFRIWNASLSYNVIFSIFYFSILIVLASFAFNYFGIHEEVSAFAPLMQSDPDAFMEKMKALLETESYTQFLLSLIFIKALVFPLNMGMLNIYHQKATNNPSTISSLFVGYQGIRFFRFLGYAIFWNSFYFIIPGPFKIIWVLLCFFIAPIMFFLNQNFYKAIALSFQIMKGKILLVIACTVVASLVSYSGILIFGFGIVLTFPFWNAMIYSCFSQIFLLNSNFSKI